MEKFINVLHEDYGINLPDDNSDEPDDPDEPAPPPFTGNFSPNQPTFDGEINNMLYSFEYSGKTYSDLSFMGAFFDNDGRIRKVYHFDEYDKLSAETGTYSFTVDISNIDEEMIFEPRTFKLFMWWDNYGEGMQPLTGTQTIAINHS